MLLAGALPFRASMRLPGLIERVERFFGLGGDPGRDPRSFKGWREWLRLAGSGTPVRPA